MSASPIYYRARHVATMTSQGVIEDGCVVVEDGYVAEVGPTRDIKPPQIDHDIDGLLTPGLINAHTHLELTNVPRPPEPGTFQNWLLTTMASTREANVKIFNAKRVAAVQEGIAQCLKFGVTCVGDISQNVDIVRPILRDGPIRSISFGECLGLGERRERFASLLARATDTSLESAWMEAGLAPHAPYTVDPRDYVRVRQDKTPWFIATTHLAESPDEDDFLLTRSGRFSDLYQQLGINPGPPVDEGQCGSVYALCRELFGFLLAHVNYCDDDCIDAIHNANSSVVWCPRTHAYFGHPPHRWRDMRAAGITVCIGTDSAASSPDLNLMDDLRLVRQQCPAERVEELWTLVTSKAADALRWQHVLGQSLGRLHDGAVADIVAWPTQSDDPLAEVLDTPGMLPSHVWTS